MTHPLRGLLIAQFCGAFNDNAWKLMVALLGIRQLASTMAPGLEFETASQPKPHALSSSPSAAVVKSGGRLAGRPGQQAHRDHPDEGGRDPLDDAATFALWMNPAGGTPLTCLLAGMAHSAPSSVRPSTDSCRTIAARTIGGRQWTARDVDVPRHFDRHRSTRHSAVTDRKRRLDSPAVAHGLGAHRIQCGLDHSTCRRRETKAGSPIHCKGHGWRWRVTACCG